MKHWVWLAALGLFGGGTTMAEALVLRGAPGTVVVPFPAVAEGDWRHLTLYVEGIAPEGDELVRLRVFIERPRANARTSPEDPRCAGEINLVPVGDGRKPAPRISMLAMPKGAREWLAGAPAMRVTVVPLTPGVVRIGSMRLGKGE
jgi:hypothetical protein